jgi:hypothetical protein
LNRARYFLVVAPIPFLMIAYWSELFDGLRKKYFTNLIVPILAFLFVILNLSGIYFWFGSLNKGEVLDFRAPKMAYHKDFVTLADLRFGIDYMNNNIKEGRDICFTAPDYQYKNSLIYLQSLHYSDQKIRTFSFKNYYTNCDFFMFTESKKGTDEIPEEFLKEFKILSSEKRD